MRFLTPFRVGALNLLALTVLTSSLAYGAERPQTPAEAAADEKLKRSVVTPSGAIVALEGVIDPATYILGPGDKVEFYVWGAIESKQDVVVAPDGRISLQSVGVIKAAGMSVAEAERAVREAAAKSFPRASISLRLTGVRSMKASISGAVEAPGVYEVTSIDRLTALIDRAGGLQQPDDEETVDPRTLPNYREMSPAEQRRAREEAILVQEALPRASLRQITVTSKTGEVAQVDLQRFFSSGDLAFNPVLRDGDAVKVPLATRRTGVVNIFGAVKSPGEYEYLPGDDLKGLVELAGGFRAEALTEDILIVRFDGANPTPVEKHAAMDGAGLTKFDLKADDRIFVRRKIDYRMKHEVTIKGEVRFPGSYSIDKDQTRLSDILSACGGVTDRANLYSARVVRRSMLDAEDPEYERLKTLAVSEMTEMEYEYFKIRSREEAPAVVVNFERLVAQADSSQDIVLQDKDEIEIPTLSPTIKVAGQVNSPGLIRYVPGENYYYYIQKAGGYSWNARKGMQRLIKAHSGTWMKPKKSTPIEIGDTIFVPEKQEVDWWELSKDLLLVASQVATVLIMIKSL